MSLRSDRLWWRLGAAAAILLIGVVLLRRIERDPPVPTAPPSGHVVFIDVEGWYRRTPDEVAARTSFDLTLSGLPHGLPLKLGRWYGEERVHDPAVDIWLKNPEVAIERTYRGPDGEIVWLSAFGSRGVKSFHLFEHTPETCYPLGGWSVDRFELDRLPLGPRDLPVNRGLASNSGKQLVFAYFYVWDSPARDPERGVLSLRLAAPVEQDSEATWAMLVCDFLPELIPSTLSWRRF